MNPILPGHRLWLLPAFAVAAIFAVAAVSLPPSTTAGQTQPSPTAAAASSAVSAAPAIDNDTAVRTLLPASVRNNTQLPGKWARTDMPDAPGGYVVFIATVYPIYDGQGGSTVWLLTNYLQWDGRQWLIGLPDYPGRQLTSPDDLWLARNLTDISALAAPPAQDWKVFTVGYTADGLVSPSLAETETVVEIYDLTLATVWSRTDFFRSTDTSNAGYVERFAEDVEWVFQDIGGDGLFELIATVKDSDEIILTGAVSAANLPAAGVTNTTTTEVYKWIDGVYVLQRTAPAQPSPAPAPAAATNTAPSTTPSRPPAAEASPAVPAVQPAPAARPTATPTPDRPAG